MKLEGRNFESTLRFKARIIKVIRNNDEKCVFFVLICGKETWDFWATLLGIWAETFDENTQRHVMKMSSSGK